MRKVIKNLFTWSLAGFLLLAATPQPGPGAAETARVASPPEQENLVYDIGFLFFRKAAVGKLSLRHLPERDLYEGVVQAETKGFIGLLSLARKDTYRSLMRLSPDGGRLIPVEFSKEVHTWGYRFKSKTHLDYQAGVMWWKSTEEVGGETSVKLKAYPIRAGVVYEDFISAFFNIRRGAYGPLRPGQRYRLLSLPTRQWVKKHGDKPQYFSVKVGETKVDKVSRTIVSINVPKDLFGQKVGDIRFHLREDLVPSRIFVENVVLFGDMKGKLRSRRVVKGRLVARSPR